MIPCLVPVTFTSVIVCHETYSYVFGLTRFFPLFYCHQPPPQLLSWRILLRGRHSSYTAVEWHTRSFVESRQ